MSLAMKGTDTKSLCFFSDMMLIYIKMVGWEIKFAFYKYILGFTVFYFEKLVPL